MVVTEDSNAMEHYIKDIWYHQIYLNNFKAYYEESEQFNYYQFLVVIQHNMFRKAMVNIMNLTCL